MELTAMDLLVTALDTPANKLLDQCTIKSEQTNIQIKYCVYFYLLLKKYPIVGISSWKFWEKKVNVKNWIFL